LGKDTYQGIASAMPPKTTILNGFSRRGLPVTAQKTHKFAYSKHLIYDPRLFWYSPLGKCCSMNKSAGCAISY